MDILASSIPTVVIGLAAAILALSLFVQVLQEIWKFLTSSSSTCYTKVLEDFLGPWATRMTKPGILPEFQARQPFQLRRLGPTGALLPLAKPELVEGLERTAPPLTRRALRALRTEAELQGGNAGPLSGEWSRFLRELETAESENAEVPGPETGEVAELRDFIASNRMEDAARALGAFRARFLPHVVDAERHFGRLEELYQFQWRRRNMRQTFVLGLLVAFFAAQPIQDIYKNAASRSAEETIALAEHVMQLYDAQQEFAQGAAPADGTQQVTREQLDSALNESLAALEQAGVSGFNGWRAFRDGEPDSNDQNRSNFWWRVRYLLGCLLTAILVSFGAPFWNDMLGVLLRIRRGAPDGAQRPATRQPGETNA